MTAGGAVTLLAVVAVACVAVGGLAYSGLWRAWALSGLRYWAFGVGWWGVGLGLLALSGGPRGPVGAVVFWLGIACALFGAIGGYWMPAVCTPRWFRRQRRARLARRGAVRTG